MISNIRYKVQSTKYKSYKRYNYIIYRKTNITKYIKCSLAHILYLNTKIVQMNQKIV